MRHESVKRKPGESRTTYLFPSMKVAALLYDWNFSLCRYVYSTMGCYRIVSCLFCIAKSNVYSFRWVNLGLLWGRKMQRDDTLKSHYVCYVQFKGQKIRSLIYPAERKKDGTYSKEACYWHRKKVFRGLLHSCVLRFGRILKTTNLGLNVCFKFHVFRAILSLSP